MLLTVCLLGRRMDIWVLTLGYLGNASQSFAPKKGILTVLTMLHVTWASSPSLQVRLPPLILLVPPHTSGALVA